ncbi:MAG TPA: TlpA disulfide reductase family protein [Methylomirabilota bacterium]|nr:TlpA disulfide reductase family protein [Methylomirabilota bacterium]
MPLLLGVLALPGGAGAQDPIAALSLMKPNPVQTAKAFRVATPDNRELRLSDFKGKVVFLNFWATWCKPCEEEMPSMERLHQRFKEQGLVVVAISEDADGASVVGPYLKKRNLTFPVGLDPKMSVAGLYGVWAIPSTFIIDKNGNRALFANGPRDWDGPPAQTLFQSLLR